MRTDIVARMSSERRTTMGYSPLQATLSKCKAYMAERSKVELFKDELKYKTMPLVELNSSKQVTWGTVAAKHIIPSADTQDNQLFEEMMLGFCEHENLLKMFNQKKQAVHDNIADQSRNAMLQVENREDQKKSLSQLFLAHGLIKASEKVLLRSEKLSARRATTALSQVGGSYFTHLPKSTRKIQDDSELKSKGPSKIAPFAHLLGDNFKQTKKVVTHKLLRPM